MTQSENIVLLARKNVDRDYKSRLFREIKKKPLRQEKGEEGHGTAETEGAADYSMRTVANKAISDGEHHPKCCTTARQIMISRQYPYCADSLRIHP